MTERTILTTIDTRSPFTNPKPEEDTLHVELVMHAYRLARSGNYLAVPPLVQELSRVFPEATPEQVRKALARVARALVTP